MKGKIFNKLTNLGSYIAVVLQHLRTKLGMPFSYSFRLIVAQYSTSFQHTLMMRSAELSSYLGVEGFRRLTVSLLRLPVLAQS